MQKWLLIIGAVLFVVGLLWPWLGKVPIGHLPGDIVIERPGFRVYFPFTSMLIVSAIISALIMLGRR